MPTANTASPACGCPKLGARHATVLILVEQSAESVAAPDVVDLGWCVVGEWSQGSGLAESAVRPVTVVVELVLAKYGRGMGLVDDQDVVEEFAADGADEAFGDGVGPRCLHGRPDDLDAARGEDGVEGRGELGVAIADEEPQSPASVVEVHGQVAGQLSQPRAGRVRGHPEDVDAALGMFDDEERVQPLQCDGVDMNKSQARTPVAWARRNSVQVGPARRGEGSMPALCRIVQIVEAPIW
jgi:hypothetical protein